MTLSFTGRKRLRKFFGHMTEVAEMPNLIEVQKTSYDQFLQVEKPEGGRIDMGLEAVFKSVFPISDFSETSLLEYVDYHFEDPKYDVEECQQRSMTYAAPLKVTLRLIVFDVDQETGAKSVKDIKEQDVYMGDVPFMTDNGTFIVNGTERVIVSQLHRSPGVIFDHDKGKTHSSGKLLFQARVIPYRGSWLDFEFDAKDCVLARLRGETAMFEISANGKVIVEEGRRITARHVRQLEEAGVKRLAVPVEYLDGKILAHDVADPQTGEVLASANDVLNPPLVERFVNANVEQIGTLYVNDLDRGPYVSDT